MNNRPILLVEDNKDDELLTLRAFHKSNIANEIIVLRDGAEAMDFLFMKGKYSQRDPDIYPSVILLDLNLPKVGGLDILKAVRQDEKLKLLPVVILTSSKEEQDLIKGYSSGANSYIRKPVDFDQFIDAVKNLGMYWLLLNETYYPE